MSSHLRIISSRIDQTRPTVAAFIDFKTAFDYADNVLFFISYYGTILFSEIVKSGVRLKEKECVQKTWGQDFTFIDRRFNHDQVGSARTA